jgi:hypothetical protein
MRTSEIRFCFQCITRTNRRYKRNGAVTAIEGAALNRAGDQALVANLCFCRSNGRAIAKKYVVKISEMKMDLYLSRFEFGAGFPSHGAGGGRKAIRDEPKADADGERAHMVGKKDNKI